MKTTNFTFFNNHAERIFLLLFFTLTLSTFTNTLIAQGPCSLACTGNIQVSLDNASCEATVTPDMVLNGNMTSCNGGSFVVEVMYPNGTPIPTSPVVNHTHVGMTLTVSVMDTNSGNSCWGTMTVEDKLDPVIDCTLPSPTVYCYEQENFAPDATDNCDDPVEIIILNETITVNDCSNSAISDEVLRTITRTYVAQDMSGNMSDECSLTFDVLRIQSLNDITPPANYLLINGTNLDCEDFDYDANGNPILAPPTPGAFGVPTLFGTPLTLGAHEECNLLVTYMDTQLPPIGCAVKIMRKFSIFEWSCSDVQRTRDIIQMIEIVDNNPPVIECPNYTLNVSTGGYECEATVVIPPIVAYDECSNTLRVDIAYPGGYIQNSNGGLAILPVGDNEVTYTVYDECLNSSTCTIIVSVSDWTAPVAICDQNTVVGVSSDGTAHVYASVFDDGSYDECELRCMVVKRMLPNPCDCNVPTFNGFTYLGTQTGSYYYLSDGEYSFKHANKEAAALEGKVAVLNTSTEFNWVHDQIDGLIYHDSYYIGLRKEHGSNLFQWVDGTALSYSNWLAGQPNDIPGHGQVSAVAVDEDGKWSDYIGDEEFRYVLEITDICGFSDFAEFCCADIENNDVMVTFRVIDNAGNFNDCMVNVEIQDKLAPQIICPYDITVDCDLLFDVSNPAEYFGEATVLDNCGFTMTDVLNLDNMNQCNVGYILRTITATDQGGRSTSCTQRIDFIPTDPFDDNNILWPDDVVMEGCANPNSVSYHPDETGWPTFIEGVCDLVGANWEDQIFPFNNNSGNACFKIIREWTVIDWCQFSGSSYPEWNHIQIIKVHNTVDPEITSGCDDSTVCTYDAACNDGFIELVATATDDCTEALSNNYKIDYFNDNYNGSFDVSINGTGNTLTASGTYPVGTHRLLYTFFDKCGNSVSCEKLFTVMNCKAPTPYCLNGLAIDLMPTDTDDDGIPDWGMVELWASDFDAGSSHPCGYPVILSFSADTTQKNMMFDCTTLGEQDVMLYTSIVTPEGDLIQAFCNTFIDIQDNTMSCGDGGGNRVGIEGAVATENEVQVEDAMISLVGSDGLSDMTDNIGEYAFPDMPMGGAYTVDPSKNDDHMNGVSTLDLVIIQRHVLNMEILNSPYKIIAADINRDNKVSAADLINLRKLILGTTSELENNESWRFVDNLYEFEVPTDPLNESFSEVYNIDNLESDMNIDFVAVKIGDVNNTVDFNLTSNGAEVRNQNSWNLVTDNQLVSKGSMIEVPVRAEDLMQVTGLQFTFNFDNSVLQFADIQEGSLNIDHHNLGMANLERGILTASWNAGLAQAVKQGDVLFTLKFNATSEAELKNVVSISSRNLKAEAYNSNLEAMDIALRFEGEEMGMTYALYQNTPNPFYGITTIGFELPEAGTATISIMDVTGKIVSSISNTYNKGFNKVEVDAKSLNASGVLYYKLEAGSYTSTRKMVMLK